MSLHAHFMHLALEQARQAGRIDEVPVGAVLVSESGEILASACNRPITDNDPTAHAEILALRAGAEKLQNYRLLNTTLYVTIEPCLMCMGALLHARVARVVYGAPDPKWGAAGSLYNASQDPRLNHQLEVVSGVCEDECRELLQAFFRSKRM
jgi:tRNA(adenine34) deaminase